MLIKELEDRINFIDKNDNFIGIEHPDKHHGLCQLRWWFTDDEREIGTAPPREHPQQLKDGTYVNLDSLVFDTRTDIFLGVLKMGGLSNKNPVLGDIEFLEVKHHILAVKLTDDNDCDYWLVMSNNHNGWYSLGWKTNLLPDPANIDNDEFDQTDYFLNNLEI